MTASPLETSTSVQPLDPILSPTLTRRVIPSILNKAADLFPNSSNPSNIWEGAGTLEGDTIATTSCPVEDGSETMGRFGNSAWNGTTGDVARGLGEFPTMTGLVRTARGLIVGLTAAGAGTVTGLADFGTAFKAVFKGEVGKGVTFLGATAHCGKALRGPTTGGGE